MTTMSSVNIGRKPIAITLTDGAIAKVSRPARPGGQRRLALRVAVRPGGCSGYSYEMFFDSESGRRRRRQRVRRRSRSWSTRPAPSCSRAPPSTTPTASRAPGSTSRTPTPPAPAAAVPPSADPFRSRPSAGPGTAPGPRRGASPRSVVSDRSVTPVERRPCKRPSSSCSTVGRHRARPRGQPARRPAGGAGQPQRKDGCSPQGQCGCCTVLGRRGGPGRRA